MKNIYLGSPSTGSNSTNDSFCWWNANAWTQHFNVWNVIPTDSCNSKNEQVRKSKFYYPKCPSMSHRL